MTPEERMLKQGQTWTHVDPSTRTYSTALGGGTTPVLYLEAADRLFRSDDQGVTWKPVVSGGTPRLAAVNPLDGLDVYAVIGGVLLVPRIWPRRDRAAAAGGAS